MNGLILHSLWEGLRLLLAIYFCCAFLVALTLYVKKWLSTRLKYGITGLRLPKPESKPDSDHFHIPHDLPWDLS